MDKILKEPLRETAGADSSGRFEYQYCYVVCHLLELHKNKQDAIVFCEFQDDFSEILGYNQSLPSNFYQIKTNDKVAKKTWTLADLTQKGKKLHSFLGYIYINYLKFHNEIDKCYFVSNKDFNEELLSWKKAFDENKQLKTVDFDTYKNAKERIFNEFSKEECIDNIFDKFIKNTTFIKSNLPLNDTLVHVRGVFDKTFEQLLYSEENIGKIVGIIYNHVKEKSQCKVSMPISFDELVDKKGVSTKLLAEMPFLYQKDKLRHLKENIKSILRDMGYNTFQQMSYINKLIHYKERILDISNRKYKDFIDEYIKRTMNFIESNQNIFSDLSVLKIRMNDFISVQMQDKMKPTEIDEETLEVILYESFIQYTSI